jgi:Tetratricopeptide repeat
LSSRFARAFTTRTLAAALLLASLTARASDVDKKAARPHYEKGATEYNLGHFADAIAEFEKAYELDPAPILLFNIAQAHRQNGNNERAAFFYRRYLEQAPNAANRADVDKRIKDLDDAIRQQSDLKRRPPTEVAKDDRDVRVAQQSDATAPPPAPPPASASPPAPATVPAPGGAGPVAVKQGQAEPADDHHVRLKLSIGAAFPRFSGRDLDQPALLTVRGGAGYAFVLAPDQALDLGLVLSYTPLPYKTIASGTSQNAGFWGVLAAATYRYRVLPGLEIQGELGAGVVWWTGLGEGNPFTVGGAGSSGPVPMPSLFAGVAASYQLGRGVSVFAQPAFVFSKTTGDGLSSAVSSVSRFELAVGLGYAL